MKSRINRVYDLTPDEVKTAIFHYLRDVKCRHVPTTDDEGNAGIRLDSDCSVQITYYEEFEED